MILGSDGAAIDAKDLAGDPGGLGAGKEADGLGDVIWCAPAAEGSFGEGAALPTFGCFFSPGGFDPTGCDGVDADLWCVVFGECLGECHDATLDEAKELAAVAFHA